MMAILIQNIFPEIEENLSGHPLSKNLVKQKVLYRFPIEGLGPDGFLAISQYKEEEICILVAFTSKQKELFDRLKEQLNNNSDWIEEKGFIRIKDAPYRLVYSPSKINFTSDKEAIESISQNLKGTSESILPIITNLLTGKKTLAHSTIYIHNLTHQELETGRIKIPQRFTYLFPESRQSLGIFVKNKEFKGNWQIPTNGNGESILEIEPTAIKALEVIPTGALRIDLKGDKFYTIRRLTDFKAVYECWLALINAPDSQFKGYKTNSGNNE